jgi:hypothetical protein
MSFDGFLSQDSPLLLDAGLQVELIRLLVGLRAGRMHRRPLAAVEHAELDAGRIDCPTHFAAERIDLTDDLPFGNSADRRIAAHLADGVAIHREQRGPRAEPRRRQRRLHTGVPGADHHNVEIISST